MVPPFPLRSATPRSPTLFYRSERARMTSLLPPPLEATGDVACIHIYKMNDTDWLGPYAEANLMFGARLPGSVSGAYSPYLYLSSDVGVAHGREVHGQPKKLGFPSIEFRGDLIVGKVERNGIDVITGTLPYKQRIGRDRQPCDAFRFCDEYQFEGDRSYRRARGDTSAHLAETQRRGGARMLVWAVLGRASPERSSAGVPLAGDRAAGRLLLARGFHAGGGSDRSRLSGRFLSRVRLPNAAWKGRFRHGRRQRDRRGDRRRIFGCRCDRRGRRPG